MVAMPGAIAWGASATASLVSVDGDICMAIICSSTHCIFQRLVDPLLVDIIFSECRFLWDGLLSVLWFFFFVVVG